MNITILIILGIKDFRNNFVYAYKFFGSGFLGVISAAGFVLICAYRMFIIVIMLFCLCNGFVEMTGSEAATWFGGVATLLTGFMALFAAKQTVNKVQEQIEQTERHRIEAILRRRDAQRALMPSQIANLTKYLEEAGKEVSASLKNLLNEGLSDLIEDRLEIDIKNFPHDVTQFLGHFLENLDTSNDYDLKTRIYIVSVIHDLNQLQFRLSYEVERKNTNHLYIQTEFNLERLLSACCKASSRLHSLFPYSRLECDFPLEPSIDVKRSVAFSMIDQPNSDDLINSIID